MHWCVWCPFLCSLVFTSYVNIKFYLNLFVQDTFSIWIVCSHKTIYDEVLIFFLKVFDPSKPNWILFPSVILIKGIAIHGIIKKFIVRLMSEWLLRDSIANLVIYWMSDTLLIFNQNLIRIPAGSSDLLIAILEIIRTRINFRFIIHQHWSVISTQTHD